AHGAGTDPSFADMMKAVSQLRRRGLAATPQDTDSLYQYTVHGVGSHRLLLRADGTIGVGAAQLERYWYVAGDQFVLCSWTADAIYLRQQRPGVWQGKWIGFGKHDVTLELHRAQSIVDALQSRRGDQLVGAEIGVWHGETSEYLLRSLPHLHLHMVDRWQKYPPSATPSSLKQANQSAFDTARRRAFQATEFAAGRRTIHRQASVQSAASFDDGLLDFVVIDAEHGYESVVADITAWLPKLKPNGILFGHDYGHTRFPGVKRAFDELLPGPLTLAPDYLVFQRKEAA
ncbi:MAG: class I SAM-dependent methyltransferase, partial [Planctomycetales bacterium]|nr:class I SAM-dependent methyltransferase [Planctomycetales bacterium]